MSSARDDQTVINIRRAEGVGKREPTICRRCVPKCGGRSSRPRIEDVAPAADAYFTQLHADSLSAARASRAHTPAPYSCIA